jgi:hypothetical protein
VKTPWQGSPILLYVAARHLAFRVTLLLTQEELMATAKKKTARGRKQDRARVAGKQGYEVRYESRKTGRSATAVPTAIVSQPSTRCGYLPMKAGSFPMVSTRTTSSGAEPAM